MYGLDFLVLMNLVYKNGKTSVTLYDALNWRR